MLNAASTATSFAWTGGLCAAVIVAFGAIYGFSGDDWLIVKLFNMLVIIALFCIPAAIFFFIMAAVGASAFRRVQPDIKSAFEDAIRTAFGGDPRLHHDFIPDIKEARLYAFDPQARHLFIMRAKSTGEDWQVLRIPFSLVRRMELLTKTNSTTRATPSGNQINITTETSSSYGIRVHYIDKSGLPGMDVLQFRDNEPLAQTWLTALGG
jgi:hypothetical protein